MQPFLELVEMSIKHSKPVHIMKILKTLVK